MMPRASRSTGAVARPGQSVVSGQLTSQLVLWNALSFRGQWTETSWYVSDLARLPWYASSWHNKLWEGHNLEGCSWGSSHDDECFYGHNWEGSVWYGAWD